MITRAAGESLLGRKRERDLLDRVLASAREGEGRVLAVHGEPGVGKTALLDYAVEAAADFRVTRAAGVEGEMELPFAALQQVCSPSLDLLDRRDAERMVEIGVGRSRRNPDGQRAAGEIERRDAEFGRDLRRNSGEVGAQGLDLGDFGAFHRPAMYSVTRR